MNEITEQCDGAVTQSFDLSTLYSQGMFLYSLGFYNDETKNTWDEKLWDWTKEVELCLCLIAPVRALNEFEKDNNISLLSIFGEINDRTKPLPIVDTPFPRLEHDVFKNRYAKESLEDIKEHSIKLFMLEKFILSDSLM